MIHVVKIGGGIVDDDAKLGCVLDELARLQAPFILVHGGGRQATVLADTLGVKQHMVDGRRITDAETLRIVTMVYAGLINKNIVAQLQARGVNALGICGADGNAIRAHKRVGSDIDYGFVGDIDEVNTELFSNGGSYVVAPITHDGKGTLLNTNADTIASEIARALAPNSQLTFAFEHAGVMNDISDSNSVITELTVETEQAMVESGLIDTGMLPKLLGARKALLGAVSSVRITKYNTIASSEGTWIK